MRRIALCSCHCCARRECPGQGRARQIRPKPGSELACFHACAQPIFSCMRTTHVFTHAHSLCCVFTHAHSPCCVHTCTCQWQVFRAFHTRHACHACASLPPDRLRHPGGSGPGFACPVLVRCFGPFHSGPETRPGSGPETRPGIARAPRERRVGPGPAPILRVFTCTCACAETELCVYARTGFVYADARAPFARAAHEPCLSGAPLDPLRHC